MELGSPRSEGMEKGFFTCPGPAVELRAVVRDQCDGLPRTDEALVVGSAMMGLGLAVASGRAVVAVLVGAYLAATLTAAIQSEEAFLLPAVAALQAPETLVVAPGWFKPNREIELLTERSGKLRLASLVDRGADFERVTFEAL